MTALTNELLEALKAAEGLPELCAEIDELEQHGSDDDHKSLKALRKLLTATRKQVRDAIAKAEGRA